MAFKLHTTDDGHLPAWELMPATAITPKVGMALYLTSGKLAIASGTNKASYICMEERAAAVTAGDLIHVVKIGCDQVWESTVGGSLTVGTAYQVTSDGMSVSTTTTSGCFVPNWVGGTSSGDACTGRFTV